MLRSVRNLKRPGSRRELPDGLWTKCEGCGTPIYQKTAKNLFVCEKCGFHHQIGAKDRIAQIVDDMTRSKSSTAYQA